MTMIFQKSSSLCIEKITRNFEAFCYSTGLCARVMNEKGETLFEYGSEIQAPQGIVNKLNMQEGEIGSDSGQFFFRMPIVVNEVFRGVVIAGPIIDEHIANGRTKYIAKLLSIVVADIVMNEINILKNKNPEVSNVTCVEYDLEREKELIRKVKMGDKAGAKAILNEILGIVFLASHDRIPIIRARVLELVVILSRAAVEGGAHMEMVMGLNYRYIDEFSRIFNLEAISEWLVKVLEKFTDMVFTPDNLKNQDILKKAITFIREKHSSDISLEDAAKSVYLSPGYFSRLFKEELGVNFSDYLAKTRIEESKKYLSDLSISLLNVAQRVGYLDQSYYTKVFKKIEGISPGQYRKNNWRA